MRNYTDIFTGISATGWVATPFKVGGASTDRAAQLKSLHALAEGAGAAFDGDLWISTHSNAGGTAPKGLVKLLPALTASVTTEFPTEAAQLYLFDAAFIWIHLYVRSITGVLTVRGVIE